MVGIHKCSHGKGNASRLRSVTWNFFLTFSVRSDRTVFRGEIDWYKFQVQLGQRPWHHCAYASEIQTYERLHQDDPHAATPSLRLVHRFPWRCQLDRIPQSNEVYWLVIGNMMLELRIIMSRHLLRDNSFKAMAIWLWVTYPNLACRNNLLHYSLRFGHTEMCWNSST